MARIVIVGGWFGGVVAAQTLAQRLPDEHQLTLVSRNHRFLFYPALVRLSFGECNPDDISFDPVKSKVISSRCLYDRPCTSL
jgi:sulfide:quinone oxidoreductase